MSARSLGDYLVEGGHVPDGVALPEGASLVGVRGALLPALASYPASVGALRLLLKLDALADEHSRVTGTPRLAAVRASPIGEADRRALAGVLGGSV